MTLTYTKSSTFTISHARHLASKVAADMHLCAQYYGQPGEEAIRRYQDELAQYLNEGYVERYEFGYVKDEKRVVCWRYRVNENGVITTDDRSGKIFSSADVNGATFYNYMWRNSTFWDISAADREKFESTLPFRRTTGNGPSDGNGYWTTDKNYFSGDRGLGRETFRPLL